jgi:hypothetical protein
MSETYPPEGDQGLGARPPETGELPELGGRDPDGATSGYQPLPPSSPKPPKQKLQWGFALLGFATPWVVSFAGGWLLSVVDDGSYTLVAGILLGLIVFGLMLAAWIVGRRNGDNRLRSFGIGGAVAYIATVLFSLLAVGACFLTYNSGN